MVKFETDYTLLSFYVGEYQFCVSASEVIEVTYSPKITEIIATPDFVVGTFLTRGVLASAINLRRKFSFSGEDNPQSCFIISKLNNGNTIAIEVDGVGDVFDGGCLQWQILPAGTVSRVFDKCSCYNNQVVFHSSLNLLFNYDGELRTAEMNFVTKLFGSKTTVTPKESATAQNSDKRLKEFKRDKEESEIESDFSQCQENMESNTIGSSDVIADNKFEKKKTDNISLNTNFEVLSYEKFLKLLNSGMAFKFHQLHLTIDNDQRSEVDDEKKIDNQLVPYSDRLNVELYNFHEKLPVIIEVKDKIKGEMKLLQKPGKKIFVLKHVIGFLSNQEFTCFLETDKQKLDFSETSLTSKKLLTFRIDWAKVWMLNRCNLQTLLDKKYNCLHEKKHEKNILLLPFLENHEISNNVKQNVTINIDVMDAEQIEVGKIDADILEYHDFQSRGAASETNENIEFDKCDDPIKNMGRRKYNMIAVGLSLTTFAIFASMGISTFDYEDTVIERYEKSVADENSVLDTLGSQNKLKQTENYVPQEYQGQDKVVNTETTVAPMPTDSSVENEKSAQFNTIVYQPPLTILPLSRDVHNVMKGDTLWFVAKYYLDNPFLYPKLADYNGISNPDLIYPGDKIRILPMDDKHN